MPVRDDARRLAAVVGELVMAVRNIPDHEIILVNASGSEAAAAAVDRLGAAHASVMVLHERRQRGYAYALRDGWSVARGELILAIDGAGQQGAAALPRLLPYMRDHAAALAYRVPGPRRPRDLLFAATARRLLQVDLHDPAFRLGLFRAELGELIPADADDELVHAQIYAAAHQQGMALTQVGLPARGDASGAIHAAALMRLLGRSSPPARRPSAAIGAAALAALGLWLLRRWRPGGHDGP